MPRVKKENNKTAISLDDFVLNNEISKYGWDYIVELSNVVVLKYFNKYLQYYDKDDLVYLGISDCASFLNVLEKNKETTGVINNIRNLLFTRIRNTISNYIFRSGKLVSTEDCVLDLNVVYQKDSFERNDFFNYEDLGISSIEDSREMILRSWITYLSHKHINDKITKTDDISDWIAYSEIKNMRKPCDLLTVSNEYTEDQIELLAKYLDKSTGSNYFNILYQLLEDKFLMFLDVFQEDSFSIPSTAQVKRRLNHIEIIEDYQDGLTKEELANKYGKSVDVISKIIEVEEL